MVSLCKDIHICFLLPFGLKNASINFQKLMDRMSAGVSFAKCYIDDIITFNLIPRDHMHHSQEVFQKLKGHNLKLHPSKCHFFHSRVQYLGCMIYPSEFGVYTWLKLRPFHNFPKQ
jgi:hypothetical protein